MRCDHFDEQVLLIKSAWDGKSLKADFLPPSAGRRFSRQYASVRRWDRRLGCAVAGPYLVTSGPPA